MTTTWSEAGLVAHFKDIHTKMPDRSFCFVLGAGASFTSGIKTAGFFVRTWLGELWEREGAPGPLDDWATAERLNLPGFDLRFGAAHYPQVFSLRFGAMMSRLPPDRFGMANVT